eukprot:3188-Eustigmatos_ZCMA.PRE.1
MSVSNAALTSLAFVHSNKCSSGNARTDDVNVGPYVSIGAYQSTGGHAFSAPSSTNNARIQRQRGEILRERC